MRTVIFCLFLVGTGGGRPARDAGPGRGGELNPCADPQLAPGLRYGGTRRKRGKNKNLLFSQKQEGRPLSGSNAGIKWASSSMQIHAPDYPEPSHLPSSQRRGMLIASIRKSSGILGRAGTGERNRREWFSA